MTLPHLPIEIPESERTPLVNWLLQVIDQQQEVIAKLEEKVSQLEKKVGSLDEELKAAKKLPGQPQIRPSTLNQEEKQLKPRGKRPGSDKRSKKTDFEVDEARLIEPEELPEGVRFNGYREYDVQDLILKRHNIRYLLAEYVTAEGRTITGKLPVEQQGHYGVTLRAFVLYQHHQCRVPQPLIVEQLREFGIEISTGQVNRLLMEEKAAFHTEQQEVLRAGLATAEYVHTDDTSARHQGRNGYCTVIGNDLFAYFSSSLSKSRENYLRLLRGQSEDYVLNEYARSYLIMQQLPQSHLSKLRFSSASVAQGEAGWQAYLQGLDITSLQAVKLLSEAALLGSAIEQGLSPDLIVLSDGAKQFAILVHALCWVHMERGIRRLPGNTEKHRQEIEAVQAELWDYYRQLRDYQNQPSPDRTAAIAIAL